MTERHPDTVSIFVRRATRWILGGYVAVVMLLLVLEAWGADASVASVGRLTSLRRSDGLAAWVVSSLAAVVAAAAWQIWSISTRRRLGWGFVAVVATAVAIDRGTRITILLTVLEHARLGVMSEAAWYLPWTLAGLLAFGFLSLYGAASRGLLALSAGSFTAAGVLQLVVGGPRAGSWAVACNGLALAAMLGVLLQELATRPQPLTWGGEPAGRRLLRRLAVGALSTFVGLLAIDLWLASGFEVNPVLRRYLNPASEASLASWLATTQSLFLALTTWLAFRVSRARGASEARGWLILTICFTYLSIDDGAMVHERVATLINTMESWVDRFPSYTWQFVYLPLLAMLGAFVVLFLWSVLSTPTQRGLVIAGLGCLVFAVGLDYIEGLRRVGESAEFRHASKAVEETMEMIGVHLIWLAILSRLLLDGSSLRIRLLNDGD